MNMGTGKRDWQGQVVNINHLATYEIKYLKYHSYINTFLIKTISSSCELFKNHTLNNSKQTSLKILSLNIISLPNSFFISQYKNKRYMRALDALLTQLVWSFLIESIMYTSYSVHGSLLSTFQGLVYPPGKIYLQWIDVYLEQGNTQMQVGYFCKMCS